jgi:ATP-binding cassette subfamily C protein
MFKKILFILDGKEKKKVIFFGFFSILIIFLDFLSLTLIVPVVEAILDPNSISKYLPGKISSLISDYVAIYVLLAFNVIIILKNCLLFFVQKYQVHFISEYNQKLQVKIFKNYIYQPISNLVKNNIAIINRNVIDLSNDYTNNLLNPLITILSDISLFIFILTLLIFAQPTITIFGLAVTLSVGISIFLINKKILLVNGEKYKNNKAERIKSLNETFGAILEVKSFKKEEQFVTRFENFTNILKNIQIKVSILGFVPKLLFEVLGIILITLFFVVLSRKIENLNEMIAIVALFAFAIIKIIPLVNKILINAQRIRYSQPLLNEIYTTLTLFLKEKKQSPVSLSFKDNINLLNIDYRYEYDKYVLQNINLTIKKNEFIAITGESGSGKSTLLKIILGLLEPTQGKVLIDNNPVSTNINKWQEKFSFVPQDVFILDDSLKNNITLESSDNKINFKKLEYAIDASNLREYVDSLSEGYNSILGDKGSRISGGQKQRIGIARAMYANTEIIIFDESTSAIHESSEIEIFNQLTKLKDKTIIFVTHRRNIKKFCNKLYTIEDNKLKKID